MKQFSAPLDRMARLTTLAVGAVMGAGVLALGYELAQDRTWDIGAGWILLAPWIILLLVPVIAFGYHPMGYTISADELQIRRPFGAIRLPLKEISGAMQVGIHDLGTTNRVFGSGGFLGYFGVYTTGRFGKMICYNTRKDDFVFVEMNDGKKYLLSPDNTAEMVDLLDK